MTESNRYRLSFHISHPSISASEITSHFAFPVRYSRSVGEKRATKAGRELGGIYPRSDVSFDVSGGVLSDEQSPLGDCVRKSFDRLPHKVINDIVLAGGECFYLVGMYADENFLVYFPCDLLSLLSSTSIGLKLDFYGGEEVDFLQQEPAAKG